MSRRRGRKGPWRWEDEYGPPPDGFQVLLEEHKWTHCGGYIPEELCEEPWFQYIEDDMAFQAWVNSEAAAEDPPRQVPVADFWKGVQ